MATATKTEFEFPMAPGKGLARLMPQADYSMKNFRNTEGREGIGYLAEITRGRTVIGEVANYGDGGGPRLFVQPDERERFMAFLAQMPQVLEDVEPHPGVTLSESALNRLSDEEQILAFVLEFELARDFKRMSRTKTLVLLDDESPEDGVRQMKHVLTDEVRAFLKNHYPNQVVRVWNNGWETL